jgi:Protein of unknown function (DUF732)
MPPVPRRGLVAATLLAFVLAGCGAERTTASPKADQAFLNSVYSEAPDIGSYRSGSQLVSLGQVVCGDLESGASVQEVGDRVPLVEGNVSLPPGDLGVVIAAAVNQLCPRFHKLLGQ